MTPSMADSTTDGSVAIPAEYRHVGVAPLAFGASAVSFFTGSAILVALGGTPPSETPLASVSAHLLWFVAVSFLAVGVLALVLSRDTLKRGFAGYLSVGTLGLGSLAGLQWAIWAYVDVLAAQHDGYEMLLNGVIAPFGTGHAIMYGLLVGGGVACLGMSLRRTQLTHRFVDRTGVALGCLVIAGLGAVLLQGVKGQLFAIMVLSYPLLYIWAGVVAVEMYRR